MSSTSVVPTSESLPSLMGRAGQRLIEAKSSAEVLESMKIAQSAMHYARVTKAANETHADCLRIIARAEIRMANEIDRGQASGELDTRGGDRGNQHTGANVRTSDNATLSDLGVSRQRVSEWREVRDAGEGAVEEALRNALLDGRAPTKSDVLNHVRGTFGTGENEWYTPGDVVDLARRVLGSFDIDPASNETAQRTVQAVTYYTKETNGLDKEWHGKLWMNPPYSSDLIGPFIRKLLAERSAGRVTGAIVLVDNRTDTSWFHEAAAAADRVCFTRGRIRFLRPIGEAGSPINGSAFLYFGDDGALFEEVFAEIGMVFRHV